MKKSIFDKAAEHDRKNVDKQFKKHEGISNLVKQQVRDEFVHSGQIVDIPLTQILDDHSLQIRTEEVSDERISEMAASLKKYGQFLPGFARPKDGKYQIIAGFTRLKALKKAGIKFFKAIINDADDDKAWIIAEAENMEKNEFTFIDTFYHIKRLSDKGFDPKAIADRLNKDVRTVQLHLQVGEIPRLVKLIHNGNTSFKQAIKFIRLPEQELNKLLTKLETLTDKKAAAEVKKKTSAQSLTVNKAKNKIKINIVGLYTEKAKIIAELKSITKKLENE
jgi:ParB/RepB/Spo0J family partition protein